MAKNLNKRRILLTQVGLAVVLISSIFSASTYREGSFFHGALDMAGVVLVSFCALGRLWCTAFLGGHKNETLITYGPFSLMRNPLYFFSFIGVCGVVMISNHLSFILLIPALFLYVYVSLIQREEVFLREQFGQAYMDYCAKTPRLFPRFRNYYVPETIAVRPQFMLYALRDSLLWLSILPFFELVEHLQETGVITPLFNLP